MHATSDGQFLEPERFSEALVAVDAVLEPEARFHVHESDSKSPQESDAELVPFHIHFSDIAFANRNETKHLPYGEGTLRAEPLREALAQFTRPATIISESPDEASSQIIKDGARTQEDIRPGA
jgi:endonuclease IV